MENKYALYKNIFDLCTIGYCAIEIYTSNIVYTPSIIFLYSILDLPFCSNSMKIHHCLCILSRYTYIFDEKSMAKVQLTNELLKCEYSSLFLLTYNIINICYPRHLQRNIKSILIFLFISTFLYYRIYRMFFLLCNNEELYNSLNICYKICFWGIYTLNLYWLSKIFKKITRKMDFYLLYNHKMNIYSLQYMYFLLPIYNVYTYKNQFDIFNVIDLISVSQYSIFYYLSMHNNYCSLIYKKPSNPDYYFYERIFLQIRSFTSILNIYTKLNNISTPLVITFSWAMHLIMMEYFYIDYYSTLKKMPYIVKYQKRLYQIPVFMDVIYIALLLKYRDQCLLLSIILFHICCYYKDIKHINYTYTMPIIMNYFIVKLYKEIP